MIERRKPNYTIEDIGKSCSKCGSTLRRITRNERGHKREIKCPCYNSDYYKKNKDKSASYSKMYREKYPDRYAKSLQRSNELRKTPQGKLELMVVTARGRAKKKGLEHNINTKDLVYIEKCPLLGIKLNWKANTIEFNSPTLDRIDSTKGYIKGNVWIISHKANTVKNNASYEEFRTIYKKWSKMRKVKQDKINEFL